MDSIRLVQFDIRGTNPINSFKGDSREKHKLVDKTCPWIIPNGSPFFGDPEMITVYNEAGGRLVRGRDYKVEGEFVPFCEVTGRSICSFIWLSQEIRDANKEVGIDYQSLGANFVPRNSLQEWIDQMQHGKIPIPWSKVFGVPKTLPPSLHMHSIKTEISDWYELSYFFKYLTDIVYTTNTGAFDDTLETGERVFSRLKALKNENLARMKIHDGNYFNPHKITKALLLLGNVPNYRAATLEEDLAGTRTDVLSTPLGIQEYVKSFIPDTSSVMLSGVLPISKFGGSTFIPPNISGSFEGLGSRYLAAAFCLENDGTLLSLSNHYDGRVNGLYFTTVENYDSVDIKAIYTSYKYENPALEALGVMPSYVVNGSGGEVIMVGNETEWFIALSNGTLDPSAHNYVRCNVSNILQKTGHATFPYSAGVRVHLMGTYVILTIPFTPESLLIYRAKTADIRNGVDITWQLLEITNTDINGNTSTKSDRFNTSRVVGSNGNYTIIGNATFDPPVTTWGTVGQGFTLSTPKPGNKDVFYFHYGRRQQCNYIKDGASKVFQNAFHAVWELNVETGVMVLIDKTPPINVNLRDNSGDELSTLIGLYKFKFSTSLLTYNVGNVLADGSIFWGAPTNDNAFPMTVILTKVKDVNNPAGLLKTVIDSPSTVLDWNQGQIPKINSPILSGILQGSFSYLPDGELYSALAVGENPKRNRFFRKVSGDYSVREGITNINTQSLLSRPLTNDIYQTNLRVVDPIISFSGNAAALAAGGVEMGNSALSVCGWGSDVLSDAYLPVTPELRAPNSSVLITFPRTFTRTTNLPSKTQTFRGDTFFGINQNIVDKLKALIPQQHQNNLQWSFSLAMVNDLGGQMFAGLNLGIATIVFTDKLNTVFKIGTILFAPTVEEPNSDHPGVHLISDLTVLDNTGFYTSITYSPLIPGGSYLQSIASPYPVTPMLQIYRDGGVLKIFNQTGYNSDVPGTVVKHKVYFEVNTTTNKMSSIAVTSYSIGYSDIAALIPKIGYSNVSLINPNNPDSSNIAFVEPRPWNLTGSAASIYPKTVGANTIYYLMGSIYPEMGWVIYLPDNIKMLIQGTSYTVNAGTIDLRDIDPDPRNKVFYLYITVEDDKPQYILSLNRLRKNNTLLLVGVITTNDKQILTIERKQPFMIGDLMLGYTREGGIIPVSTGLPQDEGVFSFLREAELLP